MVVKNIGLNGRSSNQVETNFLGETQILYDPTSWFLTQEPYISSPGKIIRIENANPAGQYQGFEGNEPVVSPVTGILLDYGTYTDEDVSSVSGEKYRTNVDLKYGPSKNPTSTAETEETTEIVVDKVGYAKILILDSENFQKLESEMLNNTTWVRDNVPTNLNSLLKKSGGYLDLLNNEEQLEQMNNLDKTLYGYKEFVENYEKFGIAGQVIYIDGFKCELPKESDEKDNSSTGVSLSMETFQNVTIDNLKNENYQNDNIQTKYVKDKIVRTINEEVNRKLNAEAAVKENAFPALCLKDVNITVDKSEYKNPIFIKQGTVIGRTYTNDELLEMRGQTMEDYTIKTSELAGEDKEKQQGDDSKLIGNYLRIILRDGDDTVVENVEDYIKVDEGHSAGTQPYKFQPGEAELLAYMMCAENCAGDIQKITGDAEFADKFNMAMGYVLINKALVNYGGNGSTIKDQFFSRCIWYFSRCGLRWTVQKKWKTLSKMYRKFKNLYANGL